MKTFACWWISTSMRRAPPTMTAAAFTSGEYGTNACPLLPPSLMPM